MGFFRRDVPPGDPDFGLMIPCKCVERLRAEKLAAECGLLPHERQISLRDLRDNQQGTARLAQMAQLFMRQPWGMWTVWGGPGNAKSLILIATINHFRDVKGWPVLYIKFKELLDYVRRGNAPDAPEDAVERLRRIVEVPLLAIDEVDKTRANEYAQEITYSLFDDRWRYGIESDLTVQRHTLIAMNSDPAELPGPLRDRIYDGRFVVTYNADPSMRPAMTR